MPDLDVIDQPAAAIAALDPLRARILAVLAEPGSASTVAATLGETRQKINYHLRTLEDHGLVRLIETRPRRGLSERIMVASAAAYALSPDVLGDNAATPARVDKLSSRYLVAVAGRLIRDVAALARSADAANKPLATLTIESDVRFATADDRAAFTRELTEAVAAVCARHHDETSRNGRWHRLVIAAHPRPAPEKEPTR
ncbi:MAG: helix-turn-helix domain-containing protein [Acidimicrobiales bacterium]